MRPPRTLVAGIGNIFFGDDAFGVEVARRLAERSLPEHVRVHDIGIRGVHLAYELLDGYDMLILVDALPRGEEPGTLTVLEPDRAELTGLPMDAHTMDPGTVLATLERLGGAVDRIVVVGCEPLDVDDGLGLSEPVAAVIDRAADLVLELVTQAPALAGEKGG
jgi:hydrogenase maturation protease